MIILSQLKIYNLYQKNKNLLPAPEICLGYDNVDKNSKPSYQRHEHRGQSLHHFHSYAVKNRTFISSYSDATPDFCVPDL